MRGVDIKRPSTRRRGADEFELLDLRRWDACLQATRGVDEVYALAADMGGMGFISSHNAEILPNNALINSIRWRRRASTASGATSTRRRPASTPSTGSTTPT